MDIEKELDRYRMTFDYHTHTRYSHGFIRPHGKGTVEQNVQAAIAAGLPEIAISDHGPGHLFYGIKRKKIADLRGDVDAAAAAHPEIKIFMSVEANICESACGLDVDPEEAKQFDFLIGGFHYGVRNCHAHDAWILAKKHYQAGGNNGLFGVNGEPIDTAPKYERLREINTEMHIKALRNSSLRILTHPGDKAPVDMEMIAKACAETGTWMEISTWHMHLTEEEIRVAMKEDVKFVISSDAHTPDRVGSFREGLRRALEAGLDPARIVNVELK